MVNMQILPKSVYFSYFSSLYFIIPTFKNWEQEVFESIEGNGENAGNQRFLLFPQCVLPLPEQNSIYKSLVIALNLDWSKISLV